MLRFLSPQLIEKEIALQVIAYNLVRALMLEAAWTHDAALDRIRFKGTGDSLRRWTPLMAPRMFAFKRARQELLRIIAADQLPDRPTRFGVTIWNKISGSRSPAPPAPRASIPRATRSPVRPSTVRALPLIVWFSLTLAFAATRAGGEERERNLWPLVVQQTNASGDLESWTAAGPFLFSRPAPAGGTVSGFRPFWIQTRNEQRELRSGLFLYPLFSWFATDETYRWSVFELINRHGRRTGAPPPQSRFDHDDAFDVWPFWFSRETDDPDTSYRALFPLAGTLKHRLGFERLSWAPFPLYVQSEKQGAVTTHTPWPFVRVTRGAAHGFALWPFFGWRERPDESREAFYLWPFGYNVTWQPGPDAPADTLPTREIGALPFYTRSSGPGYRSENYLWPLFGSSNRTTPTRYHETRYLWPFLVQGRGDDRYINRWGPFYTHSIKHGLDKTWYAWPLVRRLQLTEDGLIKTKHQFGIFLYWSLEQRSATNPLLAPASVRHLWPIYSSWDNGAGHRQFQFPSPLEVFFPAHEKMRNTWTPLFSLYRYDRRASGDVRVSLLWNGVTWSRNKSEDRKEFHLGPLLTVARNGEDKQFEIARGLFGTRREGDQRSWRLLWFTFSKTRPAVPATPLPQS